MHPRVSAVASLLVGSGLCALVYQMVWLRELRLVFGASTPASAAVLAIFMGGLGFGGLILGGRADRTTRPLALYAKLELGIAASAAVTPILLWLVSRAYVLTGGSQVIGLGAATGVRLLLSTLVIGVPTFLMGGTLPAASRAIETDEDVSRRGVGFLYGANTIGGVTGVLLATFFLLEAFGIRQTLWIACFLNAVIGVSANALSRSLSEQTPSEGVTARASDSRARPGPFLFVLVTAAVVGFAFLVMELVWYRMLGPLLGGTTYTFGLILALVLLGIGGGGAVYGAFCGNRPATLRALALTCTAEAACIALPYALGDRIAVVALLLQPLGSVGFFPRVLSWALTASIVVLPAALVAGFQFPLLIALLGQGRANVGREVGLGYAWNTLGTIAGSVAGGFVLLPLLTAPGTWRMVVLLLAVLGLLTGLYSVRVEKRPWRLAPSAVLLVGTLLMVSATGPTAAWRHTPIGAGRAALDDRSRNGIRDWVRARRRSIIWEAEGRESSVALNVSSALAFYINGKSDGNARFDAGTQVMYGLVGAILHPEPRRSMVIGLGTGSTAGWLGEVPTMEHVDVVELEPAILEVARACGPVNRDVLDDSKVRIIIGDAREVLLTSRARYDIIASEPSNPYRAGIASLFTREFYRAAASRLENGGIFLQWVQAYEVDSRTIRTIMATLSSIFPHVETWQTEREDLLLVCSKKPIQYDEPTLRSRIRQDPFRRALAVTWRVNELEGFLAHFVAGSSLAKTVASQEGSRLNTDNHPSVEFGFARTVGRKGLFSIEFVRDAAREQVATWPDRFVGRVDRRRVEDERIAMHTLHETDPQGGAYLTSEQRVRAEAQRRYVSGDYQGALAAWRSQTRPPAGLIEASMVAHLVAETGHEEALAAIEPFWRSDPTEARVLTAVLRWKQGRFQEAAGLLEEAFEVYRNDPWPWPVLMKRGLAVAASIAEADRSVARGLFDRLTDPFAVHLLEDDRKSVAVAIGSFTDADRAAQGIALWEPHVPWQAPFLRLRRDRYRAVNDSRTAAAEEDLTDFLRYEPEPFGSPGRDR